MIQDLKSYPACQSTIANHGNVLPIAFSLVRGGHSHSQSRRYRRRRVADTKSVINTLFALGKARNSAHQTIGMKHLPTTGQNLVSVSLMTHIKNQLIVRRIEHVM